MSARIETVAVVGRDASVWLTAAGLQRALGRTGIRIQVVELESRLAPVDVYAALPTLGALHQLLGIDERLVLNVCRGVPMVGQRFSNWAKSAPPFMLAFDDDPPANGDLPFVQYWAKAAIAGLRVGFEDFSFGTACARVNAVPVAADQASLSAGYGYHLDALFYTELLKQFTLRLGVELIGTGLTDVQFSSDRVTGVITADGMKVDADLYIDASGRQAALIGKLAGAEFNDWSESLPCNRLLSASGPRLSALPAFSQVSAFSAGWFGLFPLQDRTAVSAVYNAETVSDDEVAQLIPVIARMPIFGDGVVTELKRGMHVRPWIGNCVAIGEAAIAADPIDAAELHVAHACLSHLITTFPGTSDQFPEADVYNAAVRKFGGNLRDFQSAHYILNRRFDEPLWDRARGASPSASLGRKLSMFRARAMVPQNDHEAFGEQSWAALLLGSGVFPEGYDPRVDGLTQEAHVQKVQQRLRDVAALARQMPGVEGFLELEQPAAAGALR